MILNKTIRMCLSNSFIINLLLLLHAILLYGCGTKEASRPNILLIVADDMNYDSPGFTGGVAPDVTPNINGLARQSFSFEKAFSTVSVCQPSRQLMLSGLLPHNYGSAGFSPMKDGISALCSLLEFRDSADVAFCDEVRAIFPGLPCLKERIYI
jgi:N-sulfoglucosamine sulfohydrolase